MDFIDKSVLFHKVYFSYNIHKYSYHWQDSNANLIVRWDNSPFHKEIETFPHHKHEGEDVLPSLEIWFEDILAFISSKIKR